MSYNVKYAHRKDRLRHFASRPAGQGAGVCPVSAPHHERVVSGALRRYIARDADWDALLKRTRAKGEALGITSEANVERLADEYRRDKRMTRAVAPSHHTVRQLAYFWRLS